MKSGHILVSHLVVLYLHNHTQHTNVIDVIEEC